MESDTHPLLSSSAAEESETAIIKHWAPTTQETIAHLYGTLEARVYTERRRVYQLMQALKYFSRVTTMLTLGAGIPTILARRRVERLILTDSERSIIRVKNADGGINSPFEDSPADYMEHLRGCYLPHLFLNPEWKNFGVTETHAAPFRWTCYAGLWLVPFVILSLTVVGFFVTSTYNFMHCNWISNSTTGIRTLQCDAVSLSFNGNSIGHMEVVTSRPWLPSLYVVDNIAYPPFVGGRGYCTARVKDFASTELSPYFAGMVFIGCLLQFAVLTALFWLESILFDLMVFEDKIITELSSLPTVEEELDSPGLGTERSDNFSSLSSNANDENAALAVVANVCQSQPAVRPPPPNVFLLQKRQQLLRIQQLQSQQQLLQSLTWQNQTFSPSIDRLGGISPPAPIYQHQIALVALQQRQQQHAAMNPIVRHAAAGTGLQLGNAGASTTSPLSPHPLPHIPPPIASSQPLLQPAAILPVLLLESPASATLPISAAFSSSSTGITSSSGGGGGNGALTAADLDSHDPSADADPLAIPGASSTTNKVLKALDIRP